MTVKTEFLNRPLEIVVNVKPIGSISNAGFLTPSESMGSKLDKLYKQSLINQNLPSNQVFEVRRQVTVVNPLVVSTKTVEIGLASIVNILIENSHPACDIVINNIQFHIDSTNTTSGENNSTDGTIVEKSFSNFLRDRKYSFQRYDWFTHYYYFFNLYVIVILICPFTFFEKFISFAFRQIKFPPYY
jgi:hypothetical protein